MMNSLVIADLFLLLFLGLADNQMIAALLPALVKSFGISLSTAGRAVVVYSLAAGVAAFVTGPLSDRYGRRRFLLMGVVLFALASFGSAHSRTFPQFILARTLTGLAAGALSTCSITYAADWFPYNVRGRAIGLISASYFAAPILGVPIAAQLASHFGWRSAFLFFAVLAIVVAIASLRLPREAKVRSPKSPVRSPELEIRNPESEANTSQVRSPASADGSKFGAALLAFRSFLTRRDTAAALVIAFLVSGGLVGFLTYIGAWLNGRFGLSTGAIGYVFMLGGAVAVGSAHLGGMVSDRWGKRTVSMGSNLILALSVAAVPFLPWGIGLLCVFALASLGAAFRQGPLTALMTEMVPAAQRGSFIALRNISSQLGIGATVYAGGLLFQRSGYAAVTSLCAAMTLVVVVLLATHIVEPGDVAWPSRP